MMLHDAHHKRLAVFDRQATPELWDAQWDDDRLRQDISSGKNHHFIKRITSRFVSKGGKILVRYGAGRVCPQTVKLRRHGHRLRRTDRVTCVRGLFPNLPLIIGDVRKTELPPIKLRCLLVPGRHQTFLKWIQ